MGHSNTKAYKQVSAEDLDDARPAARRHPGLHRLGGIFQAQIQNEPELQAMYEDVKAGM